MALTAAEEAQTQSLIAQEAAILALAAEEPAIISNLGATDVSLSDLTSATAINDADLMLVRQGTTDKSSAFSVIKSWFNIVTVANDATFVDNSTRPASTGWVRGAMLAIATAAGFAISLATNGYIKFPAWLGGLVVQWGSTVVTSGITPVATVVTLPISFPNNFYQVIGSKADNVNANNSPSSTNALQMNNNSTFYLYHVVSSGSISVTFRWIALGS